MIAAGADRAGLTMPRAVRNSKGGLLRGAEHEIDELVGGRHKRRIGHNSQRLHKSEIARRQPGHRSLPPASGIRVMPSAPVVEITALPRRNWSASRSDRR